MKLTLTSTNKYWQMSVICSVIMLCLALLIGCDRTGQVAKQNTAANEQTGQVTGTGWVVWRYDTSNKVWASIKDKVNLDRLDKSKHFLLKDGYVVTDPKGEGCLKKSNCTQLWVYQKSGWSFGADTISACAKGSTNVNCSASAVTTIKKCEVRIVTKPATITVKGTILTVADHQDMQLTLVIVHEGAAVVEPALAPTAAVNIETNQAAFFVSPEMTSEQQQQWTDELGFPPNQPVSLEQIVPLVERMQLVQEMQRANAVVVGEGELLPLPIPFAWSLHSLDEQLPVERANQLAVAWRSAVRWELLVDMPMFFEASLDKDVSFIRQFSGPDLTIPDGVDFADYRQPPETADLRTVLTEAGYDPSKEIVLLVAEEPIEITEGIATIIVNQLNGLGIKVQTVNSETLEAMLAELQAAGNPVFLLTWY